MTLSTNDQEELEMLRASAAKFMTSPLDRSCFELERMLDAPYSNRLDSIMPTACFRLLAKTVLLLKEQLNDKK